MTTIHRHEGRAAAVAAIGLVVLIIWGCGSQSGPSPSDAPRSDAPRSGAPAPPTSRSAAPSGTPAEAAGPDVPPLRVCNMFTDAEVEGAMGLLDIPWEERELIKFGGGERCLWRHVTASGDQAEGLSIQIGPGTAEDFRDGAELDGVRGVPAADIGQAAVWFGGTDVGVLSVVETSRLGYLFVRVSVERRDLDDAGRLEVARGLAAGALPRFPGMEAQRVEPPVVTLDRERPDLSGLGYVNNLLAREEDGEWTRGQGIVATLKVMVGETDPAAVLRQPALVEHEGTGAIEMAYDYLDAGPDPTERAEIERLLDLLVFTDAQLEAMAGIGPQSASLRGFAWAAVPQGQAEDCRRFFGGTHPGVGACLEFESTTVDGRTYRVFHPAAPLPAAGWDERHYRLAIDAFDEAVPVLNDHGVTPAANLVFSVLGSRYAYAIYTEGEPCSIVVDTKAQSYTPGDFKQVIAHELGHCFIGETFPEQSGVDQEFSLWWDEGLADYLSNVAYRRNNLEYRTLGLLANAELATTLLDRSYSNSIFFQHLENEPGIAEVFAVIRSLPGSGGRAEQEAALAAHPGMPAHLDAFARALTDAGVIDTSGSRVPYDPRADVIPVSAPLILFEDPRPFGVTRLQLAVADGRRACLEYETGGDVLTGWRRGTPGRSGITGLWNDELPASLTGEAVFVVTTTKPGAQFTLRVTDVRDDSNCDPEPTPAPGDECLALICGPSGFYLLLEQLPEYLRQLLNER